jgi:hypothetical protein
VKALVSALIVLALVATACKASREGGPWAGIDSCWGNHRPFITHVDYDVGECPGGGGT